MKRPHTFPKPSKSVGARRRIYAAIAATVAMGCLGIALADSSLASMDLSSWINQQMQAGQTSTQIVAAGEIQTSVSSSQTSVSSSMNLVSGCGTTQCPAESCAGTVVPCEPTVPVISTPCEPFGDLCGQHIAVVLEGQVEVSGTMVSRCGDFLILKHNEKNRTTMLRVNIQKILYIESE